MNKVIKFVYAMYLHKDLYNYFWANDEPGNIELARLFAKKYRVENVRNTKVYSFKRFGSY